MNALEEAICPQCRKPAYFYTRDEIARQLECILSDARNAPYAHHRTFLEHTLRAFARQLRHCIACDVTLEREQAGAAREDVRLGLELVK